MITKVATFRGTTPKGDRLNYLFRPEVGLEKQAGTILPEVQAWLASYIPNPNELVVLVNAMGASEYWGQNVNGDIFYEDALLHKCADHPSDQHPYDDFTGKTIPPYGYWTFLNAHPFVHHQNKDPSRAFGRVALAMWNAQMHRVELIVVLDKKLALEHGAQGVVDRIMVGECPDVSMGCVPAGTLITMADGTRRSIEDVVEGDRVLTHRGRARNVTKIHRRAYKGDLYTVRAEAHEPVRCTRDHPFLTVADSEVKTSDSYRRWKDADQKVKTDWTHAKCLDGVHLLEPLLKLEDTITPDYVTRAFARLFGYYLAEGHVLRNHAKEPVGVEFTTHKDDVIHLEIDSLCAEFGTKNTPVSVPRTNSENAVSISVFDQRLAHLCLQHGGSYAKKKKLSEEAIHWHPDSWIEILGAYANGDGCGNSNGSLGLSTSSTDLAWQLTLLLPRLGIISSIQNLTHKAGSGFSANATYEWVLHIGKQYARKLSGFCSKVKPVEVLKAKVSRKVFSDGESEFVVAPIRDYDSIYEELDVFNLEVEEDESYIASGLVMHNCRVPYDVCSCCGNKSKTRNDYCSCIKQIGMGRILDDGRRIGVINPHPRFFDISFVFIGADKTAKVMCKLASGLWVPQSVADAERIYQIPEDQDGLFKAACGAGTCRECARGCKVKTAGLLGAGIGAGVGAGVGALAAGEGNRGTGALAGSALGALGGATVPALIRKVNIWGATKQLEKERAAVRDAELVLDKHFASAPKNILGKRYSLEELDELNALYDARDVKRRQIQNVVDSARSSVDNFRVHRAEFPSPQAEFGQTAVGGMIGGALGGAPAGLLRLRDQEPKTAGLKSLVDHRMFEKRTTEIKVAELSTNPGASIGGPAQTNEGEGPVPFDEMSELDLMGRPDDQDSPGLSQIGEGEIRTNYTDGGLEDRQTQANFKAKAASDGAVQALQSYQNGKISPRMRKVLESTRGQKHIHLKEASGLASIFARAKDISIGPPPARNRSKFPFVGTINFKGLIIHVENKPGDVREGKDAEGKAWRTEMKLPYGEFVGSLGADDDKLDVYVGPDRDAPNVHIIHQQNARGPKKGEYDEDKVMVGFNTPDEAKAAYLAHYDSPDYFRSLTTMAFPLFKRVVQSKEVHGEKVASMGEALQKTAAALHLEDLFSGFKNAQRRERTWRDKVTGHEVNKLGSGLDKTASAEKEAGAWDTVKGWFNTPSEDSQDPKSPWGPAFAPYEKLDPLGQDVLQEHYLQTGTSPRDMDELDRAEAGISWERKTGRHLPDQVLFNAAPHPFSPENILKLGSPKTASHLKWGEIVKRVGPSKAVGRVSPMLSAAEPSLPKDTLNELGQQESLEKSLATPSLMGMVLKPEEFQRIALAHMGKEDLADRLDDAGAVFSPSDHEAAPCGSLNSGHMDQELMRLLLPSMGKKSYCGPVVRRRIIQIAVSKPEQVPGSTQWESPLLSKVAAAYSWYRREQLKLAADLPHVVAGNPELHAGLYQLGDRDLFKTAASGLDSRSVAMILGSVPLSLMYSAHKRGQLERGEDVGLPGRLVAEHPWLTSMGTAAALRQLLRTPSGQQTVEELFSMVKRIWKGKQLAAAMVGKA